MKNILIVSNSDTCRSRMAQEILNSFGRGMKISTAGVLVGNSVPDVVCQVMEQNGYDFSRRKPCDVATYAQQTWDYVITLCPEAEEVQKEMQGVVRKYVSFNFADPFGEVFMPMMNRKNGWWYYMTLCIKNCMSFFGMN